VASAAPGWAWLGLMSGQADRDEAGPVYTATSITYVLVTDKQIYCKLIIGEVSNKIRP
jgi:hypothetical protein